MRVIAFDLETLAKRFELKRGGETEKDCSLKPHRRCMRGNLNNDEYAVRIESSRCRNTFFRFVKSSRRQKDLCSVVLIFRRESTQQERSSSTFAI